MKGRPEAVALEWEDASLEYDGLRGCVSALADALGGGWSDRRSDLPPRLAIVTERRLESVLFVHAGPRAGFLTAPLDPGFTVPELSAGLEALAPRIVVRSKGMAVPVAEALDAAGLTDSVDVMDAGSEVDRALTEPGPPLPTISADAGPRYVVWTSGTSGSPRGVLLTGDAFEAVHRGAAERLGLGPDDRWATTLSPSHVGGLATILRAASLGSRLVVRDRFEAAELDGLLETGAVTHASLVPVMLRRLLDHRESRRGSEGRAPAGARCLLIGGAHAPQKLVKEAVSKGYPVALTYGMTETSSQVATATPAEVAVDPERVGRPLPGVEVRIGGDGEIRVRGPTLAHGCVERFVEASNQRSDRPYHEPGLAPLPLEDGWLRTGDLGTIDGEGFLRITGRSSDRIITGGVTVDPREVEAVIRELPGVRDVAVGGLPDEEWGERVVAAVVLADESLDRIDEALERLVRERLAPAKRPKAYRVVEAIPRNRLDKVDRRALSALFADPEGGSP